MPYCQQRLLLGEGDEKRGSSQGWLGLRSLWTFGFQRVQLWAARLAVYAVTTLMLHELISLAAGRQQQA